jgi:hypothetical protein
MTLFCLYITSFGLKVPKPGQWNVHYSLDMCFAGWISIIDCPH